MKVLSKKTILKDALFEIVEEKVQYKNGRESIHNNVYRKEAVSVFALTPEYELYFIKQYRYMLGKSILEAPAGFLNNGEDALVAAKRELKEETGITANKWKKLVVMGAAASVVYWEQPLFLAQDLELGISSPEDGEEISLVKISLDAAIEKIMSGEITTGSSIIGVLMLDKMRQKGQI